MEPAKLAALERYALERREAFYQGFERLDEQRALTSAERAPEAAIARFTPAADSKDQLERRVSSESAKAWHYDSLQAVLADRFAQQEPWESEREAGARRGLEDAPAFER